MIKASIVCTYFNRQFQLNETLDSFLYYDPSLFNVIIVDDKSDEPIKLKEYPFKISIVRVEDKKWVNMEPAYNLGILEALKHNPEIIILQNAENYHVGGILNEALKVTNDNYLVFGCYSLDKETTFKVHNIYSVIEANNIGATENGQNAWYQHSIFRPVGYDFCSAITAKNLIKLNGYDERFSAGIAYGDDYLLARIKMLGLKIEMIDSPFVVHQWHYTKSQHPDCAILTKRNSDLLIELTSKNDFKAQHIYTSDL